MRLLRKAILFLLLLLASFAFAQEGRISIEYVKIGYTRNRTDSNGLGKVDYEFWIGKYEVTNEQYAHFLNCKAKKHDFHGLYCQEMSQSPYGGIVRKDNNGSYHYEAKKGFHDKPATFLTFYNCLRFINWLNNGQGNSDTETGSYKIDKSQQYSPLVRETTAIVFLPNENEWYKAAYYDPVTSRYFLYATGSDDAPERAIADQTGKAKNPGINVVNYGQRSRWQGSKEKDIGSVLSVGSCDSPSPMGTHDQNGNVWEWIEDRTVNNGELRTIRGGSFYSGLGPLRSTNSWSEEPLRRYVWWGFRVAKYTDK